MASNAIRLLLVDNDRETSRIARDFLDRNGVEVHVLPEATLALADLDKIRPEIVLVEISLPDLDGLSLCRKLRQRIGAPIIILSGRDELELVVRALDDGADDFVAKPFDLREVLARIRAHVRRARGELLPPAHRIQAGPLVIDLANRAVAFRGAPVQVTGIELAVLAALAARAGMPVSRETILKAVHGTEDIAFDRSVDVIVSRLRGKLEDDPRHPRLIKTVRRGGYMLVIG